MESINKYEKGPRREKADDVKPNLCKSEKSGKTPLFLSQTKDLKKCAEYFRSWHLPAQS